MTATFLRAGAALVDISPAMGIQLAGDIGSYRPVEEIREPLFARALALEEGGQRCVIIAVDLCLIMSPYGKQIRDAVARRCHLELGAVMLHATQIHAAPGLGGEIISEEYPLPDELWFLRGGDARYNEFAIPRIIDAAVQACAALQPAQVHIGRGIDGRVAFNRRFVMRDGSARTHPRVGDPHILHAEGPIDPEVGVMTFTGESGNVLAVLLHHTCHPVHGFPQRWVSPGWPGTWGDGVRTLCGGDCVPLVLNGACGNIHHCNHLDPTQIDNHYTMGQQLTETAATVLQRLEALENPTLQMATRILPLPLRTPDPAEVAAARALVAANPEPIWTDAAHAFPQRDWVYAHAVLDLQAQRDCQAMLDYEIQIFRLGDVALVAWMGEPFVEAQLQVKLHSPTRFTFLAHMCNGYAGYIPTAEAFPRGGYETRTSNWSRLCPEALQQIETATIAMLQEAGCRR